MQTKLQNWGMNSFFFSILDAGFHGDDRGVTLNTVNTAYVGKWILKMKARERLCEKHDILPSFFFFSVVRRAPELLRCTCSGAAVEQTW